MAPELKLNMNTLGSTVGGAMGNSLGNNPFGAVGTDFINCTLWGDKADTTAMYCQKGDIIGVRGRAESHIVKTNEGSRYNIEFIAERVTFLSNKSKKIEQELNQ